MLFSFAVSVTNYAFPYMTAGHKEQSVRDAGYRGMPPTRSDTGCIWLVARVLGLGPEWPRRRTRVIILSIKINIPSRARGKDRYRIKNT